MKLIFVSDEMPGISRRLFRGKWQYFSPDGERITDREEIDRLNAIALPPAYTDAWFAPAGNAHILATGWDAKGRKQYRYHPEFRAQRESLKFDSCVAFGRLLPLVRERVEKDLATRGLSEQRAVASIVRLLDSGAIRIGNEAYARANNSFGATTLRMKHARVKGSALHLEFKAKSGKLCQMRVTDKGLVRFVKKLQDLPGQHLFKYLDDDGEACAVNSADVNDYIRETMGDEFTAKNFRTWAASVTGFEAIHGAKEKLAVKSLLDIVSSKLGNTPAIARKSYIHPAVLAAIDEHDALRSIRLPRATRWLSRAERGLSEFLETQPPACELIAA